MGEINSQQSARIAGAVQLGGASGGQVMIGGLASGESLKLVSNTSYDGKIYLGNSETCVVVDEANTRFGVGCVPTNTVEINLPYSGDSRSITANLAINSANFTDGKKYRIGKLYNYQGVDHLFNMYHDNGTYNLDDAARSGWSMYFASSTDHPTSCFVLRSASPGTNPRTFGDLLYVTGEGATIVYPAWSNGATVNYGLRVDVSGSGASGSTLIETNYATVTKFSVDKDGVGYVSNKLGICGAPTHPLDVIKSLPNAYLIGRVCNTSTDGAARILANSNTSTVNATAFGSESLSTFYGASVASGSIVMQADGTGTMCIGTLPSAELRFGTGGTRALTIDTSQNVILGNSKTVYGGSDASGTLTLSSTTHGTKGYVYLGSSTGFVYDEANTRFSFGVAPFDRFTIQLPTLSPTSKFTIKSATLGGAGFYIDSRETDSLLISLNGYHNGTTYVQTKNTVSSWINKQKVAGNLEATTWDLYTQDAGSTIGSRIAFTGNGNYNFNSYWAPGTTRHGFSINATDESAAADCTLLRLNSGVDGTVNMAYVTKAGAAWFAGAVTVGGTAYGSTVSGGTFTLSSTSHGTKGYVYLGSSTGFVYDEVNKRVGIGVAPTNPLTVHSASSNLTVIRQTGSGAGAYCTSQWSNADTAATGVVGIGGTAVANTVLRNRMYVGTQTAHDLALMTYDQVRATLSPSGDLALISSWSDGALHTAFDINVTDSSSNSASLLQNWRVGGNSVAKISKLGEVTVATTTADYGRVAYVATNNNAAGFSATSVATAAGYCNMIATGSTFTTGSPLLDGTGGTNTAESLLYSSQTLRIGTISANKSVILGTNNLARMYINTNGYYGFNTDPGSYQWYYKNTDDTLVYDRREATQDAGRWVAQIVAGTTNPGEVDIQVRGASYASTGTFGYTFASGGVIAVFTSGDFGLGTASTGSLKLATNNVVRTSYTGNSGRVRHFISTDTMEWDYSSATSAPTGSAIRVLCNSNGSAWGYNSYYDGSSKYSRDGAAQSINFAMLTAGGMTAGDIRFQIAGVGTQGVALSSVVYPLTLKATGDVVLGESKIVYGGSADGGTITLKGTSSGTPGSVNVATRLGLQKSASVTAASTITIGDGNLVPITGTTTINYCTTTGWTSGSEVILYFDGVTIITHNAGSVPANTAAFFFASGANYTTAANTVLRFVYDGTYWRNG